MAILDSTPPAQHPDSSLRLPAQKRMTLPTSQRLTTITEGPNATTPPPPPIPRRSSLRNSRSYSPSLRRYGATRRSSGSAASQGTGRTPPPPYDWVPEPIDGGDDGRTPVEGEKLAQLGRDQAWRQPRRGGWTRVLLIAGIVVLLIIGLVVGLVVGLQKKQHEHSDPPSSPSSSNKPDQQFPVGHYTMATALRRLETGCTANPATWRCYPYTVLNFTNDHNGSTGLAVFNLVISNTSSTYAAPNSVASTPSEGIPANLTVRTTDNPFGITFTEKPMTYIASASNSTTSRYTFSFTMPFSVIPSPAIAKDNAAAKCFCNETIFTGALYISASRTYPSGSLMQSTLETGFDQWPNAVEITQTASGGPDVPDCYETLDGVNDASITTGLDPQPETAQCVCDYRNY